VTRLATRKRVAACALGSYLAFALGFASSNSGLGPGDKVGAMTLQRGTSYEADEKLFDHCNPVVYTSGVLRRTCTVPRVRRVFVGYGDFFATKKALDKAWKETKWNLWVDGHAVDLRAFGTADRILHAFPPAGYKDVILREWLVTLVGATPGKHTVRYRSANAGSGVHDDTWTFTVRR
jgi:hypothetical protein